MTYMQSPEAEQLLLEDAARHARAQPNMGVPAVYMNGRLVQFWEFNGEFMLDKLIERFRDELAATMPRR